MLGFACPSCQTLLPLAQDFFGKGRLCLCDGEKGYRNVKYKTFIDKLQDEGAEVSEKSMQGCRAARMIG